MDVVFKSADASHVDLLVEMVREFYVDGQYPFDEQTVISALHQILGDASLGRVYLALSDGEAVGYVVLTLGFSLEYQGRDAFIDEIYVRESYRGRGIGQRVVQFIEGVCRELEVRALHLEVERANTNAQAVYRKAGFTDHDRFLLTKRID